jgi:hypothetical protein
MKIHRALTVTLTALITATTTSCGHSTGQAEVDYISDSELQLNYTTFYDVQIVLPDGWSFVETPGIDSITGNLLNEEGIAIARYDIGKLAGHMVRENSRKNFISHSTTKFNDFTMYGATELRPGEIETRLLFTIPSFPPGTNTPANFITLDGITENQRSMLISALRTMRLPEGTAD